MKKLLPLSLLIVATSLLSAQTNYEISWAIGSNGSATTITIDTGDSVQWNWDDGAPHTVTNLPGSTETFDSGTLTGTNQSYTYTFNTVGTNPYQCDIHPGTMNGTITVQEALGLEDRVPEGFKLISNITTDILTIILPVKYSSGNLFIYDLLGQEVLSSSYRDSERNEMPLASINNGIYILKIESNGHQFAKRFVKQ